MLSVYAGVVCADQILSIGTLPGGSASHVSTTCDGMVAGWSEDAQDRRHAVAYTPLDGLSDIDPDGDYDSHSQSCHDGMVVGHRSISTPTGDQDQAFAWSKTTGRIDIHPPGAEHSYAIHVFNGRVAGFDQRADDPPQIRRTFLWTQAGGFIDIPNLPDGQVASPMGVDDTYVALAVNTISDESRIAVWSVSDGTQDLGRFGRPLAIRNGVMVGEVLTLEPVPQVRAFRWTQSTGLVELGTLPGGDYSQATGVDEQGRIIGNSTVAGGAMHAFVYDENEVPPMIDLDAPGGNSEAVGVDEGEVAGSADVPDGVPMFDVHLEGRGGGISRRAFRWSRGPGAELLPGLGGSYSAAVGIADGHVGGNATDTNGAERGVIWMRNLCPTNPQTCRSAAKSTLKLGASSDDRKDFLTWKFLKGTATARSEFGTPTSGGSYTLCLYAGSTAAILSEIDVPPDPVNWTPIGDQGYRYAAGSRAGIKVKVILKASDDGRTRVVVQGKGAGLADPPLGNVATPITVQLFGSDAAACWGAVLADVNQSPSALTATAP